MPVFLSKVRFGLAAKLAVCLAASAVSIFGLFGYLNLRLHQRESESMVLASADRIGDIIQRSTRYQMLHNDREALYQVIRDIGSEPGIARVRIFNQEGRISFSTLLSEVGQVVNKSAEECYACHTQAAPIVKLNRPDRSRIFTEGRQRVLAQIRPIENEPACSNAACHAHPASQQILGVIDTHLSLAVVDDQVSRAQAGLVVFTGLAVALILLVSLAFVWLVVHKPVQALIRGTRRLAGGDFQYQIDIRSGDELGDLALSFNRMTGELRRAHTALRNRADTLEGHVEQKTRELQHAQTVLMGSEKYASLGKLAATVAHEVNNPLFGILTYARLGRKEIAKARLTGPAVEQLDEQLHVIERESRRCGEIMRNLLTFARQAPPRRDVADLNELVQRAVTLVRHQLELQGVGLETRYAPDLPRIPCDPGEVQQAVLVLLMNACEAMPQGGRLIVSTATEEAEVAIGVKDTGNGIPASLIESIFEPFFTTKEDQHRTGLGLAVAKSVVERHGGRIDVASKDGEGTEFTIRLPVFAAEFEPAGEPA
ncbi:MAG: sensor histidine kinase [Bryobacteraceae bacterium]